MNAFKERLSKTELLEKDQGGSMMQPEGGYDDRLFRPALEWGFLEQV